MHASEAPDRKLANAVAHVIAAIGFVLASAIAIPCANAQSLIVYPARGQSQEQAEKDKTECFSWARQQTGFDPTASHAPPPTQAPQGGVARGAARGAAVGVVGGAIAGDAGKGAAIGAASGALIGGFRRRDQVRQQEYTQQQYAAQQSEQHANYNRACSACLEARGYTVR